MNPYMNPIQKRALEKLDPLKWKTSATLKESMMTLDALAKRELAEFRFLKYSVVWRRKA